MPVILALAGRVGAAVSVGVGEGLNVGEAVGVELEIVK